MVLPEFNITAFWRDHARHIPRTLVLPFAVFGTLAVSESQAREQKNTRTNGTSRSRSRSTSRTRPRRMATSGLGSVLDLYVRSPGMTQRIFKAVVLDVITDSLMSIPLGHWLSKNNVGIFSYLSRGALSCLLIDLAIAPIQLLRSEIIVFKHFDWRSLQMNGRILPIFLPNLLRIVLDVALGKMARPLKSRWLAFVLEFGHGLSLPLYQRGLELGLVLSAGAVIYLCRTVVEIVRTRLDLAVLNGDSDHTVIPIDETFEGGLSEGLSSTKDYDVWQTMSRYLIVATAPTAVVYACSWLAMPLIGMVLQTETVSQWSYLPWK